LSKLTKTQIKDHNTALDLLQKETLTYDEKLIVYEKWNEGANSVNSEAGAFFTPIRLAKDFSIEIHQGSKVIDLCAGIGMLSFFAYHWQGCKDITCIELNPTYVEVGKKLLPNAKWICTSIFDYENFEHYDQTISNPPFGKIKTGLSKNDNLNYKGSEFDLITIEIASKISDYGTFIVPQMSTPFRYSGCQYYEDLREKSKGYNPNEKSLPNKVEKFIRETGLEYEFNCGIDTSIYLKEWKGVSPMCEIINFDFTQKQ
jgi:hypothetical protein